MAAKVTCDICGKECSRWYNITAAPAAMYSWQHVGDMMPVEGTAWHHQICKGCYDTLVQEIMEMKQKQGVV